MTLGIFNILWDKFIEENTSAKAIHDLFINENENVINDHIALRTFDDSRMNINIISEKFIKLGYVKKGEYIFNKKHLRAIHLEHKKIKNAPKVFISELIVYEFSDRFQKIVNNRINSVGNELYKDTDLILKGCIWSKPSYEEYKILRKESEYAAWLYVHGFKVNHFTVSINALQKYDTIEKVNNFIKKNKYKMNTAGGEIKGTPEKLLQQSSTLAEIIQVEFKEGIYDVPACFYEFAIRYRNKSGQIFSGFITENANKIFESTNLRKDKEA